MFRSDKQRRAMFAAINGINSMNRFSSGVVKFPITDDTFEMTVIRPKFADLAYDMRQFSKGRAPKVGEIVYTPGDPEVGIFGAEGRVVGVHKSSADIQFGFGKDAVVEELGFEEFEDQESLKAQQELTERIFTEDSK